MAWSKLTVMLAMALILSQTLCVAQCAWQVCPRGTEAIPPCHRHHSDSSNQTPASCAFEIVATASLAPAQASAVQVPAVAAVRLRLEGNPRNSGIESPVFAAAFSPPVAAPLVLRI